MTLLRRAGRFVFGLTVVVGTLAGAVPTEAQSIPGQSATVVIADTGLSPANVTIPAGGSVTWTNQGSVTHTAESTGGPAAFNTAGIGPGQSATLAFTVPGIYAYTSGADCPHGVFVQTFT